MRARSDRSRTFAVLLLLAIVCSIAPASPCSMQASEARASADHGCCAKGVAATPPPCCHAQDTSPVPAMITWRGAPAALPTAPFLPLTSEAIGPLTAAYAHLAPHLHSPPSTVLRI